MKTQKTKINDIRLIPIGMSIDERGQLWQDYRMEVEILVLLSPAVHYIDVQVIPFEKPAI